MYKSKYEGKLLPEEQVFAAENFHLIREYLNIRKLPYDEWFDVVIFRYLLSVKRWFAIPELHEYKFKTIAFCAMRSAIGHEYEKQKRRVKTISLCEIIPGTTLTYEDVVADPKADFYARI